MLIGSPGVIANYIGRIPKGETREIERLRNELARQNGAQASCPVTTAIYPRIAAEVALRDLADGRPQEVVVPFWRVMVPDSKIANKTELRQRSDRALPATRGHWLKRDRGWHWSGQFRKRPLES